MSTKAQRHPNVVNLDEVAPTTSSPGGGFGHARRKLSGAARARALGCSHMEVPPGKRAWPHHWHAANEEALYILAGRGTLRIGDECVPLRAGDYAALPVGPAHAHQLINDGDAPLAYLCISTMHHPDIGGYPDSGKIGVFAGSAPGGSIEERYLAAFLRVEDGVGYYDGELTGPEDDAR